MTKNKSKHWTEDPEDNYTNYWYYLSSDVADQLGIEDTKDDYGTFYPSTLHQIIREARSKGKKVAVVVYDDNDADNVAGPLSGMIFEQQWRLNGKKKSYEEEA